MWTNHRVTVDEADEAVADVDALWLDPDPKSKSGSSIRVSVTAPAAAKSSPSSWCARAAPTGCGAPTHGPPTAPTLRSTGNQASDAMSRTEDRIKAAQAESEATRDEPYPPGSPEGERPGRAQSVVQSVRLPADAMAEIEAIAGRHDVPVGALIRGWVLAALAAERGESLTDAVDQLVSDAERVRRLANDEPA